MVGDRRAEIGIAGREPFPLACIRVPFSPIVRRWQPLAGGTKVNRISWVLYTAVLGGAMILVRALLAFLVRSDNGILWYSITDFIGYGLILEITNINVLENRRELDAAWKKNQTLFCVFLVVVLVTVYAVSCFGETGGNAVHQGRLGWVAAALAVASLIHNYAVSDRLEKTGATGTDG